MKNILITGASSGIGEALTYFYAKNTKNTLFICGRNKKRLEDVAKIAKSLGAKVETEVLDVNDKEAMKIWIETCEKKSPLNLVIANAGIATGDDENIDAMYNTFETNINGVLHTILPVLDIFKKAKRKDKQIAIISSIAGYHGLPSCPAYSASKACVKAFGEALRGRYAKNNIKVNVICPGFVRSRITDKNKCPMPFFMETDKAAEIIATRLEKNIGLIAFPWPIRLAVWVMSCLPNCLTDFFYARLPHKV